MPPIYDGLDGLYEERIGFEQGGRWGFLDEKGRVVIEPQYHLTQNFSEGLAPVCIKE